MLLKILLEALIHKAALELANILLDTRKAKYIVRLLGLLETYPIA